MAAALTETPAVRAGAFSPVSGHGGEAPAVTRAYRRVGVELPSSTERRRLRRIGYSAAHSASFATVFMLRAVPDLAARIFSFDFAMPFP